TIRHDTRHQRKRRSLLDLEQANDVGVPKLFHDCHLCTSHISAMVSTVSTDKERERRARARDCTSRLASWRSSAAASGRILTATGLPRSKSTAYLTLQRYQVRENYGLK